MSPALPREERDAIRARAEAATDGPWFREFGDVITSRPDPRAEPWQEEPLAERIVRRAEHRDLRDPQGVADADFITHARTDVPALLDALDAVEAENERLREMLHIGIELDNHHNAARCPYCQAPLTKAESERDAARAEVAALRGRIEAIVADVTNPTHMTPSAIEVVGHLRRALAADEGERTGR